MTIKKKHTTQKAIAAQVGIGPDFLSHIVGGRKPCPRDLAPKLEAVTGIEKSVWMWPEPGELRQKVHDFIYSEPKQQLPKENVIEERTNENSCLKAILFFKHGD